MNNIPSFLIKNPSAHFMEAGAIGFVPAWIILLTTILTFAMLKPKFFRHHTFFAFVIGSLMPVLDDLFAFVFGPPFAHHSVFHSLFGPVISFLLFLLISNKRVAKFAFLGNLYHIIFNLYFDRATPLFPFTYQEFGLTDALGINTYWIKAAHYPIIFILFACAVIKFFTKYKNKDQ